ncbi:hypothetical protein [Streptomyces sp. NRRL S-1022]|uniref:hypothetical protein n=1 Tax=Streptomyces sp. NRRL S-1022 TaxID=1463880 RepID=UPI00131B3973|nr:hypothetical protein [Streptomyces sp. NRRL S-1022]
MATVERAIAECREFLSQFSDRPDWNGGSLNFIFAGHGTTRGDLVLADAKLSPDQLMCWLAERQTLDGPSRKLQLVLDSCYSGMTLAQLMCHESHRTRVLLVDAFAAAMHDEKAWELTSLGHGALSYSMASVNSLNIGGNPNLALAIEIQDEEEIRKYLYRAAPNPVSYLTNADQHSLELTNGHSLSIKGLGTLDIFRQTTPDEICEHLEQLRSAANLGASNVRSIE